jgi:hypothetical protein
MIRNLILLSIMRRKINKLKVLALSHQPLRKAQYKKNNPFNNHMKKQKGSTNAQAKALQQL